MATVIPLPSSQALGATVRAVLYGRASKDRHKRGRSIRDQFLVGQAECDERGWDVVDRYEDRDRSATRRASKAREEFERMIADAEAGSFDVIVYAERSRISRDLSVSVALRDLCLKTGVLICYDGRLYDVRKPADFKEFTRDAVQSEEEGESIIARNQRTATLAAKRGGVWAWIPFGYKREYDPDTGELVGQVPHPEEALALQELFQRVDTRESITSLIPLIAKFRPGITHRGVSQMLRNKTYIGIRKHYDKEYPASWPGIIDEPLFWRVQQILDDPERRTNNSVGIRYLLTGIAHCSKCRAAKNYKDAPLKARPEAPKHKRGPLYKCRHEHLTMFESHLDAVVTEAVLHWLASPAARKAFERTDAGPEIERQRRLRVTMAQQLEEARQEATTFDEMTGLPHLSASSLASLEQSILPVLKTIDERIRQLLSSGNPLIDRLIGMPPEELEAYWEDEMTISQRRAVVRQIVRVELLPGVQAGGRWRSPLDRVKLIFMGAPGFTEWPNPDSAAVREGL